MIKELSLIKYVKNTWKQFSADDGFMMAGALSYYTLFSIAPLLVVLIAIMGMVVESSELEAALFQQLGSIMGHSQAEELRVIVEKSHDTSAGIIATIISTVTLIVSSTAVVIHLKDTMNRAWNVTKDPDLGFKAIVVDRVLSLGFLLGLGFILLVSMGLNAIGVLLSSKVSAFMPNIGETAIVVISSLIGLLVTLIMFFLLFKFLPDAKLHNKDLMVGVLVTTILFSVGKYAIGYYLGNSNINSTFGGAGALASFMVWVYYNAIILIIGAEFTQVYALSKNRKIYPSEQSVKVQRVIKKEKSGKEI